MKLYSYYRSSCSYRVRIGLNLKGLSYEYIPVHLKNNGGEQFSESYSQKNPGQMVPTLEVKGKALAESVAIFEYLEETISEPPLYPTDSFEKAKMRQLIECVNSGIQPLQNLKLLIHLKKSLDISDDQKMDWIRHWINSGFNSLEKHLSQRPNHPYSFGPEPSALDCFIVPQVYNALRFGVDMNQYPILKTVNENCLKLPAFEKAHPDNQPDTPS